MRITLGCGFFRASPTLDFISQREKSNVSLKYVIVELKADNQIEDAVVQAKKDFAQQIAVACGMEYRFLKAFDADKWQFRVLMRIGTLKFLSTV